MYFVIAATWADQIKSDSGYGEDLEGDPTADDNVGYSDHLRHRYWHYIDIPFSQDGTALPSSPTPNASTQIATFRAVLASTTASDALKSYDLVWLLHLVGDVHQPLHCSTRVSHADPLGDGGGNGVRVGCCPTPAITLHKYWDDLAGKSDSPATAIEAATSLPTPDATAASDLSVADWTAESAQDAQDHVYVSPIGPGHGSFTIGTNSKYRKAAKTLARERIALAGMRLAKLLNDELE
jgi:hypothetical protein